MIDRTGQPRPLFASANAAGVAPSLSHLPGAHIIANLFPARAIGRIVDLHATYYHRQADFGLHFESRVARELSHFCERFVDGRDGLWLALKEGNIEGSIAIDGLGAMENGAQLRWFICSDSARGMGLGKALLTAAIAFCRSRRYELVYLWTFAGLDTARHLYEKFGFRLVHEQRGAQWGVEVSEQRFELRA